MKTNYPNLRDTVNILLTDPKYTNYTTFSNHQLISHSAGDEGSLENAHDSVHGTAGGAGGHSKNSFLYAPFPLPSTLCHGNKFSPFPEDSARIHVKTSTNSL